MIFKKELSKKSPYYISPERRKELEYFCLQYNTWIEARDSLNSLQNRPTDLERVASSKGFSDPVEKCVEAREAFQKKIDMVDQAAWMADPEIAKWIVKSVAKGLQFDKLNALYNIPCSRGYFYTRLRIFFWALNKLRDV